MSDSRDNEISRLLDMVETSQKECKRLMEENDSMRSEIVRSYEAAAQVRTSAQAWFEPSTERRVYHLKVSLMLAEELFYAARSPIDPLKTALNDALRKINKDLTEKALGARAEKEAEA